MMGIENVWKLAKIHYRQAVANKKANLEKWDQMHLVKSSIEKVSI